ncbi:unnamed protein product, partial [Phaeothamnion confervicola]
MGKVKRNKKHGFAARATPLPKSGEGDDDAPSSLSATTSGGGVLQGLQSMDATVRESSCAAIAGVLGSVSYGRGDSRRDANWGAVAQLVSAGVVKKLLHRLVDRAPAVRVHAAGALANMAAIGDPKLCERMVKEDALTPVLRFLDEAASASEGARSDASLLPADAAATAAAPPREQSRFLLQLAAVLTGLLEASDAAVTRFTRTGGLPTLLRAAASAVARERP